MLSILDHLCTCCVCLHYCPIKQFSCRREGRRGKGGREREAGRESPPHHITSHHITAVKRACFQCGLSFSAKQMSLTLPTNAACETAREIKVFLIWPLDIVFLRAVWATAPYALGPHCSSSSDNQCPHKPFVIVLMFLYLHAWKIELYSRRGRFF